MEDWALFMADRDLQMDIVAPAGEREGASAVWYRRKGVFIDGTLAAATAKKRSRAHDSHPRYASFVERSFKRFTLAVDRFGRLGTWLID